ncbi:hypothetical protein [Kluyvera ascorbata]|uniref:hypothetical protein n=1 Tax=Kluyvera ascorbata TaxID=51288 RepID=UPI002ABCE5FA|nr:hypothetical protein [Kluyvera ascorbata]MDZ4033871.1 hypothetical protein [Kluyvera ascorbata]
MAGLTKEQRTQREAERLAAGLELQNVNEQDEVVLVAMVTDAQLFPGAPTTADVHPDEVENWQALGWRLGD